MNILASIMQSMQEEPPFPKGLSAEDDLVLPTEGGFWLPEAHSNLVPQVDWPFHAITWISIFFLVLITAVMLYFMWKYALVRGAKTDHDASTHNTPLEITWSAIPLVLVIGMFYVGFKGYMDMTIAPDDAYTINVTAKKWSWEFTYPNGHVDSELHVPAGENVKLVMKSLDVLHALFIPDFRVKNDVVPGKYSSLWFNATKQPATRVHRLFCTEYCGTGHSTMLSWVVVHPNRTSFEAWMADAMNLDQYPPAVAGNILFQKRGCAGCHTLDGTTLIGPPLNLTWDQVTSGEREFESGRINLADYDNLAENYIRESISNPLTKIVKGYPNSMPVQNLNDDDIDRLVAFIKWFSENDYPPFPLEIWDEERAAREAEQN